MYDILNGALEPQPQYYDDAHEYEEDKQIGENTARQGLPRSRRLQERT